jgi:hypothetical protein
VRILSPQFHRRSFAQVKSDPDVFADALVPEPLVPGAQFQPIQNHCPGSCNASREAVGRSIVNCDSPPDFETLLIDPESRGNGEPAFVR